MISGRSQAASLLGRTKPGREAEAGGEVGRVFFAGPSCAAGYPDQMMTGANCSAGAWSSQGSASCCLVKVAWSCSFLLAQGAAGTQLLLTAPGGALNGLSVCHKVLSTLLLLISLTAEAVQDPTSRRGQCLDSSPSGAIPLCSGVPTRSPFCALENVFCKMAQSAAPLRRQKEKLLEDSSGFATICRL